MSAIDVTTDLPHNDGMAVVQWVVLSLTLVTAGLASYLYNDGRDHHIKLVHASIVIGLVGTALFVVSEALSTPASSLPQCDWSNLDEDLAPQCETDAEASWRAANESGRHFVSSYIIGPTVEFAAVTVGGVLGLLGAMATRRRPSDGRPREIYVDD
jgi:hypothetical protein